MTPDVIVVGARKGGLLGRYHMGAAVNSLLHSSTVPIALAPVATRIRDRSPA